MVTLTAGGRRSDPLPGTAQPPTVRDDPAPHVTRPIGIRLPHAVNTSDLSPLELTLRAWAQGSRDTGVCRLGARDAARLPGGAAETLKDRPVTAHAGPRAQSSGRVFIEFGTGTSFCWMFAYNSINSTFTRFYCFWFARDFRIGGPSAFAGAGYSLPKIWKDAATCELHASPRESECSGRNAAVPVVQSRPFR